VTIHALAATVWTGGHLVLDLGVLPRAMQERSASQIRAFEEVFEPLGLIALAIEVLTGLGMGWIYLPGFRGLFSPANPIGLLVGVKLSSSLKRVPAAAEPPGWDAATRIDLTLIEQPSQAQGGRLFCPGESALIVSYPGDFGLGHHAGGDRFQKHLTNSHGCCNRYATFWSMGLAVENSQPAALVRFPAPPLPDCPPQDGVPLPASGGGAAKSPAEAKAFHAGSPDRSCGRRLLSSRPCGEDGSLLLDPLRFTDAVFVSRETSPARLLAASMGGPGIPSCC
jgi:hypothetical protein